MFVKRNKPGFCGLQQIPDFPIKACGSPQPGAARYVGKRHWKPGNWESDRSLQTYGSGRKFEREFRREHLAWAGQEPPSEDLEAAGKPTYSKLHSGTPTVGLKGKNELLTKEGPKGKSAFGYLSEEEVLKRPLGSWKSFPWTWKRPLSLVLISKFPVLNI